jgi:hypothetical protein
MPERCGDIEMASGPPFNIAIRHLDLQIPSCDDLEDEGAPHLWQILGRLNAMKSAYPGSGFDRLVASHEIVCSMNI